MVYAMPYKSQNTNTSKSTGTMHSAPKTKLPVRTDARLLQPVWLLVYLDKFMQMLSQFPSMSDSIFAKLKG